MTSLTAIERSTNTATFNTDIFRPDLVLSSLIALGTVLISQSKTTAACGYTYAHAHIIAKGGARGGAKLISHCISIETILKRLLGFSCSLCN